MLYQLSLNRLESCVSRNCQRRLPCLRMYLSAYRPCGEPCVKCRWQLRAPSVGSVAAVAGAAVECGCVCNVAAVDARPSATRATEQRVLPRALAGALPLDEPTFTGHGFAVLNGEVERMALSSALRAPPPPAGPRTEAAREARPKFISVTLSDVTRVQMFDAKTATYQVSRSRGE